MLPLILLITATAAVYLYNESEYHRRLYYAAKIDELYKK